ncbi:MAG: AAA family ATPase [Bacillota bacterium]|nr:AAA family ATPase [Bacillota bacterium]
MEYTSEILDVYKKMMTEGKLLSDVKLQECYETFRGKFGPDKLKSLDGEVLLNTLFNHSSKDSLVYWLEFKNDDEFSTNKFGGIAGGSAIKFGIYRRKEDGKWISGSSKDMKELSVQDAITIAREKRDLLIKGAEIVSSMLANYEDQTYQELQNDLYNAIENLSDAAWVHKYFHMLFPEKIDDFHSADYQRFYLIKLHEIPVSDKGKYAVTGQIMRAAKSLNIPIHKFTAVLGELFGSPHKYWRVGTRDGDKNSYWDKMRNGGYVSIGWPSIGDLRELDYSTDSKARVQLKELLNQHYPNDPRAIGKSASQILSFVRYIQPDEIVLAADGETVLGIGRVTGKYQYINGLQFPHTIEVQWLMTDSFQLPNVYEGKLTTVNAYKDHQNILDIEKRVSGITVPDETGLDPLTGILGQVEGVLKRKKQVILYGPPGTGKTYWAEKVCSEAAARKVFGKTFDSLDVNEQMVIRGNGRDAGLVRMCCFHPSYGYEDFIEGIRASVSNGQTLFSLQAGIFKKLCNDAGENPDRDYYLIIDEINRGDISRIFGELITIIEVGKRGKQILLSISGESFSVPQNLYIVGTMNTADRSIALLDVALRRRFGFVELMPDTEVLGEVTIEGLPLGLWLGEFNKNICMYVGRDARNLQIGHSYFMENGRAINDFDLLRKVIHEDIIPLLEEYCYGDYLTLSKILGNALVDTDNQMIRHELFKPSKKEELIAALQETCPEISTSSKAQVEDSESDSVIDNDETIGAAE